MVKKFIYIYSLIIVCIIPILFASEKVMLKADFKKETVLNGRRERVEGIFYFVSPDMVFLDVRKPIKQDVIFKGNLMLIYYPNENVGFEIETNFAAHYSFFNAFLHLSLDKMLLDMNYRLVRERKEGEKIFSEYRPPKRIPFIETITIVKQQNRIVTITVRDRKGKVICETSYGDYLKFDKIAFPKKIKTVVYEPTGIVNRESIVYRDVEINPKIPEYYTNFTFPKNASIKKVKIQ